MIPGFRCRNQRKGTKIILPRQIYVDKNLSVTVRKVCGCLKTPAWGIVFGRGVGRDCGGVQIEEMILVLARSMTVVSRLVR